MAYLLGYDIGSSSVKAALVDVDTGQLVASATSPDQEMKILSQQPGWAEQHPEDWWREVIEATRKLKEKSRFAPDEVAGIGISYQMHGLVMVDKQHNVLRPSIIWCDSRAVSVGDQVFRGLGEDYCLSHLLNSPGNFTASKLKWVKENEPGIYEKVHKIMLPGDYIALKMTGEAQTTVSGLSEGIMWDFKSNTIAYDLLEHLGVDSSVVSDIVPTFGIQATVHPEAAQLLGVKAGTPVTYRAGDQPNNAFSLNVLNPGEIATTAGTSGVVYGIAQDAAFDPAGRINSFVHVNSQPSNPRLGVLMCVNGTGILNSWLRRLVGNMSYEQMNDLAFQAPIGANKLVFLPFGNGAERILGNTDPGAMLRNLSFTTHSIEHVLRAAQEGIVFALALGLQIMETVGVRAKVVRAGQANMFLSPLFREAFVNTTGAALELYNTDGAQGAARAAGVGAGVYRSFAEAFESLQRVQLAEPNPTLQSAYQEAFARWQQHLYANENESVNS